MRPKHLARARKKPATTHASPPTAALNANASRLDRIADFELQHGHVAIAERLSRQAAELREAGQ
jgi:hypothetical protein